MLSSSQFNQVVKSKKDYHAACLRNGYRIPSLTSKLCTFEFLQEVRNGEVYVPRYSDLKVSPCPVPPTIPQIQDELVTLIEFNLPKLPDALRSKF